MSTAEHLRELRTYVDAYPQSVISRYFLALWSYAKLTATDWVGLSDADRAEWTERYHRHALGESHRRAAEDMQRRVWRELTEARRLRHGMSHAMLNAMQTRGEAPPGDPLRYVNVPSQGTATALHRRGLITRRQSSLRQPLTERGEIVNALCRGEDAEQVARAVLARRDARLADNPS